MANTRPLVAGPASGPESPFPLQMEGKVIKGFGRGSKELGIPTANLPVDATVTPWISDAKSGVYFGWASLELGPDHPNHKKSSSSSSSSSSTGEGRFSIFPMVMSIGYNPFYNNTVRSAEVHVLDKFAADFYGVDMRLLILGYIRDEKNYEGLDALIEDINTDCEVARRSLERPAWKPAGEQDGKLDCSWLTR
ncbi:riboflavin kinase [Diaporthe amygdali]|uniref:riboflavin kinase n=1 Tax=Phomopsis amygdali TaxID=1214568 RepID=UPI0022FF1575|nr:riboflavin kinase [Diaporthe amygdali]KAJ0109887.1 riboflavin kinase [Diaporthe amygdali]